MSRSAASEGFAGHWQQRAPERRLLFWALVTITLGYTMLLGAGPKDGYLIRSIDLLPLIGLAAGYGAAHLLLVASGFRGDQVLLPATAFLCGAGVLAQYRMGVFIGEPLSMTGYAVMPAGALLMAAGAAMAKNGRYRLLARWPWGWALLSVALIGVLLVTGQRFRGGVYAVGFVTPTELLKLTVVLFAAAYIDLNAKALANWRGPIPFPRLRPLWPLIGFFVLLLGLLLLQRDLGMVVILAMALLSMLAAGTRRAGYLVYGGFAAAGAAYLGYRFFDHVQSRVETWLEPFRDPTGSSWQILQGFTGMYSGGLWGEGFSQARPRYTPIAESDFIYAVIAEELGFAGGVLLAAFFLLLLARLLLIAARARSAFGMLAASGVAAVFATQIFLNLGGVTKFVPLTGLTLPFVSHGGSSLLTAFASLGLALAISDGEPARKKKKRSASKRGTAATATARGAARR